MTLPGLALFYGGLVRSKNYLSVLMHNVAIATIIIIAICKAVTSLRVREDAEILGLDEAEHGENAYNLD